MDEHTARKILEIDDNGDLRGGYPYISWAFGDGEACLDGYFTPDHLEAIAWWMRNSKRPE